jgi:mannose/fructose-specific phosphotransferase system component IIA
VKPAGGPTGLVIVTHGEIGRSLIDVAEFILDQSLSAVRFVSFRQSEMEKTDDDEIHKAIESADQGCGVLVLTDIGGASPCNYTARLLPSAHLAVVSGINLAMLIRVWNYRDRPLRQLVKLATEGAIRDIVEHRK